MDNRGEIVSIRFIIISVFVILIAACGEDYIASADTYKIYTFTDERDDNTYKTVMIGSQIWMTENLAYIPFIGNSKQEGIWVYNSYDTSIVQAKTSQYYISYGGLYNWEMAQQACPSGWHLPSDEDWKELMDFVRNDGHLNCEGVALKSATGWMNGNGTDDFGFHALPAGVRNPHGDYYYEMGRTLFWTSTPENHSYAWAYDLVHTSASVRRYAEESSNSFSVRCIKD